MWRDYMQNVEMLESSTSSEHSQHSKYLNNIDVNFCIEGKIHRFGHSACKPGERTEYPPGVVIHSDHSGPYANSYGGARYSQLFLDRSGYLWGFRQKKK